MASKLLLFALSGVAFFALLCFVFYFSAQTAPLTSTSNTDFVNFTKAHRKLYFNEEEFNYRAKVYRENLAFIDEINERAAREEGEEPFRL